jgi:hypothetical protein
VRERERLIARIRQIRRAARTPDESAQPATADVARPPTTDSEQQQLQALETRVSHLEALVQGLQDSVHRESTRNAKRISELEARVQPAALGKALSEDARARGL